MAASTRNGGGGDATCNCLIYFAHPRIRRIGEKREKKAKGKGGYAGNSLPSFFFHLTPLLRLDGGAGHIDSRKKKGLREKGGGGRKDDRALLAQLRLPIHIFPHEDITIEGIV